jgi:hypothetical protein
LSGISVPGTWNSNLETAKTSSEMRLEIYTIKIHAYKTAMLKLNTSEKKSQILASFLLSKI